MLIRMEEA